MKVAVAGGTGLVGGMVVAELRAAGHEPVVLSRSRGVDLRTGSGLAAGVAGCRAVIDVSNVVTISRKTSVEFFAAASRNLVAAAHRAGVEHLVALSIVGCDRVDFGYYFGKRAQEEVVAGGPVPWTILRATQFFEFPEPLLAKRIALVPRMLSQPVAAADTAAELVRLVEREPVGRAPELGGPERLDMVDVARRLSAAHGRRGLVVPVSPPGRVGAAMRGGALLPRGEHACGNRTFAEHLAAIRAAR
ncbi:MULTISPECIES: SDR family oxidoreductase [unclassified Saccharopolyspora]|uniref:SDR family oxidoreductase n=1 Tax=unclassified Saccharopolyspora TaxID=2646250 RepID=UPI001CD2F5E4|nr:MULTISPECIES: NAD(P)H-binding protein [unclassified Saccharopolyspora]MCA1184847.1 NAD(P)H-binding protein [Saccharopolyspora sp. 6T]MCA1190572.1 NAD(P)H-binding protein [Saccharopolyspora sp. 6V]MCA1280852.1 NAD(P)H-binding protein [Saccharopolyspora sp. 7B]